MLNDQDFSAATVRAAQILQDLGRSGSQLPLLKAAVARHASAEALLGLYHAAVAGDDMCLAQSCRDRLGALSGTQEAAGLQPSLSKLNTVAEFSLELLEEAMTAAAPLAPYTTPHPARLLYVLHNSRPFANGGYATRAHGLALGLKAAGFDVHCITRPGYPSDMHRDVAAADVPLMDMIDAIPYHRDLSPSRRGGHRTREYGPAAADVLEARFRAMQPAAVIAASAYLSALPALVAARRVGIPFVYEVRGFWEITRISDDPALETGPLFRMERFLETQIARQADQVLTLTGGMRDELIRRGVDPEKITLCPNSCDPSRFTPRGRDAELASRLGIPPDVPVIGYIGTFVGYEGLDDLAHACGRLHARGVDFRLMVVGSENTGTNERGPIARKILEIAGQQGFMDKLLLPGRVPHHEVEGYYSLIDVAPFPHKPQLVTEMVSPMKPLEALAMEKAVLVSSVQALAEMVVPGETGLVFEKGDIDSLAEKLALLLGDPALRAQLGKAGREWVRAERTWDRTAGLAKDVIKGLGVTPA
jgi:glycosyltransferase involved in cell wall biosynthesis